MTQITFHVGSFLAGLAIGVLVGIALLMAVSILMNLRGQRLARKELKEAVAQLVGGNPEDGLKSVSDSGLADDSSWPAGVGIKTG